MSKSNILGGKKPPKVSKSKAHMDKVHCKMSHLHNQPALN